MIGGLLGIVSCASFVPVWLMAGLQMAPFDMVEYIYFIDDSKPANLALYQIRENESSAGLETAVGIPSVIPSFTKRPALPLKKATEESLGAQRISIQERLWRMAETGVNWWRDPAGLLTAMTGQSQEARSSTSSDEPPLLEPSAEPNSTQSPFRTYRLLDAFNLGQGAENPIQPMLKEAMETPAQARAQVRRHFEGTGPIRSELERDQGLSVILTDQFVPIAYV